MTLRVTDNNLHRSQSVKLCVFVVVDLCAVTTHTLARTHSNYCLTRLQYRRSYRKQTKIIIMNFRAHSTGRNPVVLASVVVQIADFFGQSKRCLQIVSDRCLARSFCRFTQRSNLIAPKAYRLCAPEGTLERGGDWGFPQETFGHFNLSRSQTGQSQSCTSVLNIVAGITSSRPSSKCHFKTL